MEPNFERGKIYYLKLYYPRQRFHEHRILWCGSVFDNRSSGGHFGWHFVELRKVHIDKYLLCAVGTLHPIQYSFVMKMMVFCEEIHTISEELSAISDPFSVEVDYGNLGDKAEMKRAVEAATCDGSIWAVSRETFRSIKDRWGN